MSLDLNLNFSDFFKKVIRFKLNILDKNAPLVILCLLKVSYQMEEEIGNKSMIS